MSKHPNIAENDDVELVQVIWDYLAGKDIDLIASILRNQCNKYDISCKDRYDMIYHRNLTKILQYEACVVAILDALSVPEAKRAYYKKAPNLYVLLKKLEPDNRHLTYLIKLIDETNPQRRWAKSFFLAAIGVAGLTVLFWFKKNYVTRLAAISQKVLADFLYGLDKALMLVRNTPLLGLLYNGIALIWAWRQAFKDGFELEHDKLSVLFLRNVEHVFPIIGFLICFFAGGVMTPAAFALFFIGSSIDFVEGIYSFGKHEIELWWNPPSEADDYYSLTASMRIETLRSRDKVVLLTNVLASFLIMASVAIWCVFPPSWVITVSCVVCGWLVGMSKGFSIDYINERYANKLQRNLDQIKQEHESEWKPLLSKPAHAPNMQAEPVLETAQAPESVCTPELGAVDNSSVEARCPAACPRDPGILLNTQIYRTEIDQTGSREQAAGRSVLDCQQPPVEQQISTRRLGFFPEQKDADSHDSDHDWDNALAALATID